MIFNKNNRLFQNIVLECDTGDNMYRNIKNYEIRYTDVDSYDILKLSSLLGFMQESAGFSADELGFGYNTIKKCNIGFIMSGWYVELFRPIRYGEVLTVHTWPIRPNNVIFLRDFELYVGEEKVGAAVSRWCMMDVVNFKIMPVLSFFKNYDLSIWNTERSLEFNSWKIRAEENPKNVYVHEVGYGDYDHYFHMNNTRYADYLISAFSDKEFKGKFISKMQISYIKQCKIGDKLEFFRADNGGVHYIEGKVDGELRVQMKVLINEI